MNQFDFASILDEIFAEKYFKRQSIFNKIYQKHQIKSSGSILRHVDSLKIHDWM